MTVIGHTPPLKNRSSRCPLRSILRLGVGNLMNDETATSQRHASHRSIRLVSYLRPNVPDLLKGDKMVKSRLLSFLNEAKHEELIGLPRIGPVLADKLIMARPFENLKSVEEIRGISAHLLEKLATLFPAEVARLEKEKIAQPKEEMQKSVSEKFDQKNN